MEFTIKVKEMTGGFMLEASGSEQNEHGGQGMPTQSAIASTRRGVPKAVEKLTKKLLAL